MKRLILAFLAFEAAAPVAAQDIRQTDAGPVRVERMIGELDEPWAIGFLPGGGVLVTERAGRILHVRDGGERISLSGVPQVAQIGQGGLLDLVPARDFAETRELFLSYAMPSGGGAGTALAVARLSADGRALENLRVIFEMSGPSGSGQHFGSRVVEARDGTLFLTIGDRGDPRQAQNLQAHNGKVIRVNRDGSIPMGNPFAQGGGQPEIWSYGHRNPQGAALDETGRLWTVEHGARGGDETNTPEAGKNYGWPVISYGRNYSGTRIGVGTERQGMEQPRSYWDPSIAPSGMMIYQGDMFPRWQGDIFVGSLVYSMISRLERDGSAITGEEWLFRDDYVRIRDVREAPDGSIWFLSVGDGAAYRVTPG